MGSRSQEGTAKTDKREAMQDPHPHEDPERTTPTGLARYSVEFMQAALAADDKLGRREEFMYLAPVPVLFLVGQAIELALKAYLVLRGESLKKLRMRFGHNLGRCLRRAQRHGLPVILEPDEEGAFVALDTLYASKELQYIVAGVKTFPTFGPLERAALKIIHAIVPLAGYRADGLPQPAIKASENVDVEELADWVERLGQT